LENGPPTPVGTSANVLEGKYYEKMMRKRGKCNRIRKKKER
jgi:hypothetical protein